MKSHSFDPDLAADVIAAGFRRLESVDSRLSVLYNSSARQGLKHPNFLPDRLTLDEKEASLAVGLL